MIATLALISLGLAETSTRLRWTWAIVALGLGAALIGLWEVRSGPPPTGGVAVAPSLAGVATAMVVGFVVIPFVLRYFRERDPGVFVYYRRLLAALVPILVRE